MENIMSPEIKNASTANGSASQKTDYFAEQHSKNITKQEAFKERRNIFTIKSQTNCLDVLSSQGIPAKVGTNISCPLGTHEDKNPSFNIYADGEKVKCHSCGFSGDALDLQQILTGQTRKEAMNALLTGGEVRKPRTQTRPATKPREISLKNDFSSFIKDETASYEDIRAEFLKLSDFKPDAAHPRTEATELLRTLYTPAEFVFIGGQCDAKTPERVKSRDAWRRAIEADGVKFPLFCLNPVKPEGAKNANGETSYRTAANITAHRYALAENDKAGLREQAAFWKIMIEKGFPVRALIFSGNKSIHSIFEADPGELPALKTIFQKLGFDGQTFDPARTARMPGHRREDTGKFQSILFLRGAK
jgi:hypothetical protein